MIIWLVLILNNYATLYIVFFEVGPFRNSTIRFVETSSDQVIV